MPIRQFLYRRAQGSPIWCCGLNLLRARRTVLAAHVEFLEMKVEGADQFLLVFVLVRAMVSRDCAKCNLRTGRATALDGGGWGEWKEEEERGEEEESPSHFVTTPHS
jgi:hypothetical protein